MNIALVQARTAYLLPWYRHGPHTYEQWILPWYRHGPHTYCPGTGTDRIPIALVQARTAYLLPWYRHGPHTYERCSDIFREQGVDWSDSFLHEIAPKCIPTEVSSIAECQELISGSKVWINNMGMHHIAGDDVYGITILIVANQCLQYENKGLQIDDDTTAYNTMVSFSPASPSFSRGSAGTMTCQVCSNVIPIA